MRIAPCRALARHMTRMRRRVGRRKWREAKRMAEHGITARIAQTWLIRNDGEAIVRECVSADGQNWRIIERSPEVGEIVTREWEQAHVAMMEWLDKAPMEPYDIRRVYDDPPTP